MAGERSARSLPPLLSSRPLAAQAALAVGGPVALGALCGVALGLSEAVYLGLSLLAALGAVAAGFEHARARSGLLRGVVGGCLFGAALLAAHAIAGARPLAKLPDPPVVLVVFTTLIGAVLGALGAWLRGRRERAT
jgi:NO-binding membrane sensor protein with MHYT domain